jgi:hypothetical protein
MSNETASGNEYWSKRLRERFGSSVRLTSKLELAGDRDVVMKLGAGAAAANMQSDEGAFEVWALALRLAGASTVQLALPDGEVPSGGHGGRFGFRVNAFGNLFPEWFRLAPGTPAVSPVISEPRLGADGRRRFVLNREGEPRVAPDSSEAFSVDLPESKLEALLAHDKTLSANVSRAFGLQSLDRQLPVGLFEGTVSEASSRFTGGKSAVDLWGVGKDGERLVVLELKNSKNEKLGGLSELFFYCILLREVQTGMVRLPLPERGIQANYLAIPSTTTVEGYLLAPSFHPLLEGDGGSMMRLLNTALAAKNQRVTLGLAKLGTEGQVQRV